AFATIAALPLSVMPRMRASADDTLRSIMRGYVSPPNCTLRGTGASRSPLQALHFFTGRFEPTSSSYPGATPVPSHASHWPCLVLNENQRGSSSGTPVPHSVHARAVESISSPREGDAVGAPAPSDTDPPPHAIARSNEARSSRARSP